MKITTYNIVDVVLEMMLNQKGYIAQIQKLGSEYLRIYNPNTEMGIFIGLKDGYIQHTSLISMSSYDYHIDLKITKEDHIKLNKKINSFKLIIVLYYMMIQNEEDSDSTSKKFITDTREL